MASSDRHSGLQLEAELHRVRDRAVATLDALGLGWLPDAARRLNLYQALILLQRQQPQRALLGGDGPIGDEGVFLRPSIELTFPVADIDKVDVAAGRPRLSLTLLGLYGVDSPLPSIFAEQLAQMRDEPEGRRICDFLDTFSHRLYSLLFRAWKRSRPVSLTDRPDDFYDRVLALVGYSSALGLGQRPHPGLIETRLLVLRARTARGLELVIRLRLKREVRVTPLLARRVGIPQEQATCLGKSGNQLNDTLLLGRRAYDRNLVRVHFELNRYVDWVQLMPGGRERAELDRGVAGYLQQPIPYIVRLRMPASQVPTWSLARGDSKLGLNAWLGRPRGDTVSASWPGAVDPS
jgi:type VI secretion system protein ImpH